MRRRYTVENYLDLVSRLKKNRPNISLSSDFIVGFPNESQQDFEDTLSVIDEVRYDESFSFIYSPRPNTPAAEMEDNVSLEEKDRLAIYKTDLIIMHFNIGRKMVGTIERCLVTGISKKILASCKQEPKIIEL